MCRMSVVYNESMRANDNKIYIYAFQSRQELIFLSLSAAFFHLCAATKKKLKINYTHIDEIFFLLFFPFFLFLVNFNFFTKFIYDDRR
jgi:hypothetical protein